MTELHEERLDAVLEALLECGAESVLDLGCGPGELLVHLVGQAQFRTIVGIDTSPETLAEARSKLVRQGVDFTAQRLTLFQASFTSLDEALTGFDAAVLVETIEHVAPHRLSAVERAVFANCRPKTVIITTPNHAYNVLHGLAKGSYRHPGHRFEWDRDKFRGWAAGVARRNGYRTRFADIGERDPELGSSTQMATFSRT